MFRETDLLLMSSTILVSPAYAVSVSGFFRLVHFAPSKQQKRYCSNSYVTRASIVIDAKRVQILRHDCLSGGFMQLHEETELLLDVRRNRINLLDVTLHLFARNIVNRKLGFLSIRFVVLVFHRGLEGFA